VRPPIARQTPQQIVDRVLELDEGTRFQVLAPVVRGRKGEYASCCASSSSRGSPGPGWTAWWSGSIEAVAGALPALKKYEKHTSRWWSTGWR
jgi:excinuclease ABC subunit A